MSSDKPLLLKQYRDLAKNVQSLSNGQVALKIQDEDEDFSLDSVCVTLRPADGPYRGGKFDFEIDISDGYPSNPPTVKCQTQMYHPNIDWYDEEGDVCLNLLDELWTSEMTLQDVVQGLLFLLYNPNIEDPLSSMFMGSESEEDFLSNVRKSLRGEEIDGVEFERNLLDGYESEDETEHQTTISVQSCTPAVDEDQSESPETQTTEESVSPDTDKHQNELSETQTTNESESASPGINISVATVENALGDNQPSQTESDSGKCTEDAEDTCISLVMSNLAQCPYVHDAVESSVDREFPLLQQSVAKTLVNRVWLSVLQVVNTVFKNETTAR